MATGNKLASSIDAGLGDLSKQEAALAEHLKAATDLVKNHRTKQARAYRDLASMRLDDIAGGKITQALDAAEESALRLLGDSDKARRALEAAIRRSGEKLNAAEAETDAQGDAVEAAEKALDASEARLQTKLAKDQSYRDQAAATEEAVRIADEAERKTALAEEDRVEKGKPYEADPLFMYLWNRGFGTAKYRSWGIIKALDQWVARLCDYHAARPNYTMLLEIPDRLRAHTDRVAEKAQAAVDGLAALEKKARDSNGVTGLELELEKARQGLAKLEEREAGVQDALKAKQQELARFGRGEDEHTVAALRTLSDELRQETLRRLQHEAMLTPDPRDDRLVDEIEALDQRIEEAEQDVAMRQESLRVLADRRAELEQVRKDFRNKRYHTNDFKFKDYGALEALLEGLLRGAVTGSQYWGELHRNAMRRRPPRSDNNFGSRGYRRSSSSRRSSTSWSGGGGFRSGGSFGGGSSGFKTGGGF